MRLPCTCCGETNIALACSNFLPSWQQQLQTGTIQLSGFYAQPKETGPQSHFFFFLKSHATFAAVRHYFKPRRDTPLLRVCRTSVASAWRPRLLSRPPPPSPSTPPSPVTPPSQSTRGSAVAWPWINTFLKRRHRCHNTQEKVWRAVSPQYLCCILLRKPYSSDIPRIDSLIRL